MKIVKVTYTTTAAYADTNQANIKIVMADLQKLAHAGIKYNVCIFADGKTFIHTAFFKTDEDHQLLNELPSFKNFQQQLKASMPEIMPKQDWLTLVGSSTEIFKIK